MSGWLLYAVTAAYGYIAAEQAFKGNIPGAVTWGGYALANFGLMGWLR